MAGAAIRMNFSERRFLVRCVGASLVPMRVMPKMKRCRPIFMSAVRATCSPSGLKRYGEQKENKKEFFHRPILARQIDKSWYD